jgi:hypothetical protein
MQRRQPGLAGVKTAFNFAGKGDVHAHFVHRAELNKLLIGIALEDANPGDKFQVLLFPK